MCGRERERESNIDVSMCFKFGVVCSSPLQLNDTLKLLRWRRRSQRREAEEEEAGGC